MPRETKQPAPADQPVALTATWYCRVGVSRCTAGHPDVPGDQLYAAISPDLGYLRGHHVQVCWSGRCVRVTVIDCDCQAIRSIDLYADAFEHLAPTSAGRLHGVALRVLQ